MNFLVVLMLVTAVLASSELETQVSLLFCFLCITIYPVIAVALCWLSNGSLMST